MPWGDGTGPWGGGPMTGRAAGFCAGYPVPGYANSIPGRGFRGGAYFAAPAMSYPAAGNPYGAAAYYGGSRSPYGFGPFYGSGRRFGFGRGFGRGRFGRGPGFGRGWW